MADITYHADPNVISYIGEKVRKETYYLGLGTEIPSGANLNDYKTPGVYITASDSVTASLSNWPSEVRGNATLIVRKVINGAIVQELKSNTNAIGASRYYDSAASTWGEWSYDSGIDAVIARGTSYYGWEWVKYASGVAHMFCRKGFTATTSGGYLSVSSDAFPFGLMSGKAHSATIGVGAQGTGATYPAYSNVRFDTNKVDAYINKPASSSAVSYWVYYDVWGFWK